jgi:hypothetical protein
MNVAKTIVRRVILLAALGALSRDAGAAPARPNGDFDPLAELDGYNVVWNSASRNSAESMPLGGGDIGCNVWVENGDLLFYAQESGAFDKNGEFLKTGRFRIHLDPNPFSPSAPFRQEFKLRQGCIEITAGGAPGGQIQIRLWVEVKRPVIHIDLEAAQPVRMTAAYESWRYRDVILAPEQKPPHTGRRSSLFDYDCYQENVVKKADAIDAQQNHVTWCQDDGDEFNAVDFALQVEELSSLRDRIWDPLRHRISGGMMTGSNLEFAGVADGIYRDTPFRAWTYRTKQASRQQHLAIACLVAQPSTPAAWEAQLAELAAERTEGGQQWANNLSWWQEYWQRTYVIINPGRGAADNGWRVGRNYNVFRYELGGNFYGQVPTKFNGGNLTFDASEVDPNYPYDPDYRRWGGWSYTSANQRLVYWPFLKNGDFDGMISEFDVYRRGLGNAEARTQAYFGHGGCSFAEQFQLSGLPVAAMYGFVDHGYSWRVRPANFPRGEMANPAISTFFQGQLEHAFMILEYQRFTGRDISAYLPFIFSSLRFYDEHFQQVHRRLTGQPLDARGRLVIYPSTPGENHLGATDPADAVAGLQAITGALLELPAAILSDGQLNYLAGFKTRIPSLPILRQEAGGQMRTLLAVALNDSARGGGFYPNLHAVFPYNLLYAGGPDFESAIDTWEYAISPANKSAYIGHRPSVIYSARLGLTDEAKFTAAHKLDDRSGNASRFPTFVGPGFDWSPDHNWTAGGMIGLQEMLLQTPGRQLRLLPAWPRDWDVTFKLHAPYNTTVEGRFANGRLEALTVTPTERARDVVYPESVR